MRINTMEILYLYYAMAGKLLNFDIVDKKNSNWAYRMRLDKQQLTEKCYE